MTSSKTCSLLSRHSSGIPRTLRCQPPKLLSFSPQRALSSSRPRLIRPTSHIVINISHPVVSQSLRNLTPSSSASRYFSNTIVRAADSEGVDPPDYLSEAELKIFNKLKDELRPVRLEVQDISGGCGSMYGLDIVSTKFKGLSVIKQHKLVNSVLAEEIKGWHGVQLKTKAP